MIQVTLTFTSLSAALRALRDIPESTLDGALTDITPAEEAALEPPAPKSAKRKPAPEPAVAPAPPIAEPEAAPPPVAAAVTYPELQKAVMQLAGRNREAALGVAKQLGVGNFKELPSDRWPEAMHAVTARLTDLEVMQ